MEVVIAKDCGSAGGSAGRGAGGDGQRVPRSLCRLQATAAPAEGSELEVGVAERGENSSRYLSLMCLGGETCQMCLGGREKRT